MQENSTAPLALLVHGRAGNSDVMWTFARCLPPTASVLAPQAPFDDPVMPHSPDGKSWWRPDDTRPLIERGREAAGKVRAFLKEAIEIHALKPARVVALGFSQGAAVLSALMQIEPQLFTDLAILSGFVIEMPPDLSRASSPNARLPRIFMTHGSNDETVPIATFDRGVRYLEGLGIAPTVSIEPVGHKVGSASMRALREWLAEIE